MFQHALNPLCTGLSKKVHGSPDFALRLLLFKKTSILRVCGHCSKKENPFVSGAILQTAKAQSSRGSHAATEIAARGSCRNKESESN